MSEQNSTKLTDEELFKFKEISRVYQETIMEFGQLHLDRMEINKAVDRLREKEEQLIKLFDDTKLSEKNHIDSILKKYGEGNLSLKDGTFTKIEQK